MGRKISSFKKFKETAASSQKGKFKPKGTSKIAKHLKGGKEGAKGYKTLSESAINEDLQWYIDNGYIKSDKFKTADDLKKDIMEKINPAMEKFCQQYKISPVLKITGIKPSRRGSEYLDVKSDNFSESDMGIFKNCFEYAHFYLFNGKEVAYHVDEESGDLYFRPFIWGTLHVEYQSINGGSNGLSYPYHEHNGRKRDAMWYDIVNGVWIDTNKMAEIERNNRK